MGIEFNIAHRLSSRRYGLRAGVMERVASIATTISVAVIIVTLSVVDGFKVNIDNLLSGAASDIMVTAPDSRGVVSASTIKHSSQITDIFERCGVVRYSPYLAKEGVIKSDDNILGVLLKGVDSLYDCSFFAEHLVEGELPRLGVEPRAKDVIISQRVARKMDLDLGDRIEMVFVDSEGALLRDRFSISGIFDTGLDIIDNSLVISDIRNVERFYNRGQDRITGYELWIDKNSDKLEVADRLNSEFIDLYLHSSINVEAFTFDMIYPTLYGWLATHDVNALFITIIMIIVSLLNMTTALLIIVLERQRMIGELRAMGMKQRSVVRIFIFRAMFIIVRGVIVGAMIGVLLSLVQNYFGIVPLPSDGYILTTVPASLCWGRWALALLATIALTLVMMIIPALLASRVSPSKAIRYE